MDGRCGRDAERFTAPKALKPLRVRWKSPEPLRLRRIEEWRQNRFEQMLDRVKNDDDRRKACHAASLYEQVSLRLNGCALGAVTSYR